MWFHQKEAHPLEVYKVFNFSGEPYMIQAIQDDKSKNESIDYFDMSWRKLNLKQNYPNSEYSLKKPACLDQIIILAKKLSAGMSMIRTDFYIINGRPYFSEFTFYSDSGMMPFHPSEWDHVLGQMIDLPK